MEMYKVFKCLKHFINHFIFHLFLSPHTFISWINTAPYWMHTSQKIFFPSFFLFFFLSFFFFFFFFLFNLTAKYAAVASHFQYATLSLRKVHVLTRGSAPADRAHVLVVFLLSYWARTHRSRHLLWLCMWCVYSLKLASSPSPPSLRDTSRTTR